MDADVAVPALIWLTVVMVGWCVVGWLIYGGGRGKDRPGGLFWALWKFMAIPWTVAAAGFAILAGFYLLLMLLTGSFND